MILCTGQYFTQEGKSIARTCHAGHQNVCLWPCAHGRECEELAGVMHLGLCVVSEQLSYAGGEVRLDLATATQLGVQDEVEEVKH